jgi:hypothetical protein
MCLKSGTPDSPTVGLQEKMKHATMKNHIVLSSLSVRIHDDIDDLREVINLTEQYLKKETVRLQRRVSDELEGLSSNS